jgi:hypothetical protein
VSGLAKTYGDRVKFVRVNIHDPKTAALQAELGFTTTPEFFLLDPKGHILHYWDEDLTIEAVGQVLKTLSH